MSKTTKKLQKSGTKDLNEPTPQLVCTKLPTSIRNNDAIYRVRIPFKYMLLNQTAAWYEFRFIGMRYEKEEK